MHESVYQTIIEWDEGGGKRSRRELTRRIVALYTAQQTQGEAAVDDKTEREIAQLIDERDAYHLWADKLADAIAMLTSTEIGEHTSGNLPWFNALTAADVVLGGLDTVADAETTDAASEAMRRFTAALTAQQTAVPLTARPLDDWHEDDGPVLWWQFPIEEPPYVGSPLSDTWPGYHTHWTPIFVPTEHGITPKESSDD